MNKIKLSLSALAILTTFSACGTGPELTPQQMQEVKKFDVSKITNFAKELHTGMNQDNLLFYAPLSIEKAQEAYEDATEADAKDEKLLAYEEAKKALANAYQTKKLVQKYLADVGDINKRMQAQNTKDIYPDRYEDFMDNYKELIQTVDKGETSDALEDKKEVMIDAKDLYGDAVVYRNINKAKTILDSMEDEGLDELAPQHYEKARKIYEEVRQKIKQEPDNHDMIAQLSKKANEAALYAQTLAKDIFNFRELSKEEQEAYFAKLHRKLTTLNPREGRTNILPLPIYEKIDYLQDLYKSCK